MKKVIFSILFLMVATAIFAQRRAEKERSKTAIADLKNGALIVRLQSNHKKLAAMRKADDTSNTENNIRLKKLIKDTEKKTREDAELFAKVMADKYNFSAYYLMWDYSLDSLKQGIKKGYFLNNDLEVDPNIELKEEKYLTLWRGFTKNMKLAAFRVTDQDLKNLDKPFPNYYRVYGIQHFFNTLLFAKTADLTQVSGIVENMNHRFEKYYSFNF